MAKMIVWQVKSEDMRRRLNDGRKMMGKKIVKRGNIDSFYAVILKDSEG